MTQPRQTDPQFKLRLPVALKAEVERAAGANNRTMNAEIVHRLKVAPQPLTAAHMADALGCFWNAAIGASHRQQDGIVFAGIMAEGFAAVADRLAQAPSVSPETMRAALVAAERFIVGFEDDETQEGIAELLATIRAAIGGAV